MNSTSEAQNCDGAKEEREEGRAERDRRREGEPPPPPPGESDSSAARTGDWRACGSTLKWSCCPGQLSSLGRVAMDYGARLRGASCVRFHAGGGTPCNPRPRPGCRSREPCRSSLAAPPSVRPRPRPAAVCLSERALNVLLCFMTPLTPLPPPPRPRSCSVVTYLLPCLPRAECSTAVILLRNLSTDYTFMQNDLSTLT